MASRFDDLGTGHSSLAYLHRLPVRRLKIVHLFLTAMVVHAASTAIVHSIIELARALVRRGRQGVEDDATLLHLLRT